MRFTALLSFALLLMASPGCPDGGPDGPFPSPSEGGWQGGGPPGGDVRALAVAPDNPRIVYAGTSYAGVYRSTDGGQTWSQTALRDADIFQLIVDPQRTGRVYAIAGRRESLRPTQVGPNRVLRSDDVGRSWSDSGVVTDLGEDGSIFDLALSRQAEGPVYIATSAGVLRSQDQGASFSLLWGGPSESQVTAIAVDPQQPQNLLAGTYSQGLWRSTDGGANWQQAGLADANISEILFDPCPPTTIYVATSPTLFSATAGLYRSIDNGTTWARLEQGFSPPSTPPASITTSLECQAVLYALRGIPGQSREVFRSTERGEQWERRGELPYPGTLLLALGNQEAVLAATAGGGLLRSEDGGQSWRAAYRGLGGPAEIILDPERARRLYAVNALGLWMSSNDGASWQRAELGIPEGELFGQGRRLVISPSQPRMLYFQVGNRVVRSQDDGRTWNTMEVTLPAPWEALEISAVDASNPMLLYGAASVSFPGPDPHAVFRSTDGGQTWTQANTGLIDVRQPTPPVADPRLPNVAYTTLLINGVYRTTDAGQSWQPIGTGGLEPPLNVFALAVHPGSGAVYAAFGGRGLYRWDPTTDAWVQVSIGQPGVDVRSLSVGQGQNAGIVAVFEDGRVFLGEEGAQSRWRRVDTGRLPTRLVQSAAVRSTPLTLYLGTYQGIYSNARPPFLSEGATGQ